MYQRSYLKNRSGFHFNRSAGLRPGALLAALLCALAAVPARADQVEMQNGDRYVGTVESLNANTLVLHSSVLGTVRLPRGKVALITLGSGTPPAAPAPAPPVTATHADDLSAALRQLGMNTNLLRQVRAQFLNGAGPEANNRFNQMIDELASGRMNADDLRAQAKSAADQLRAFRKDLGEDGWAVDGYLTILDNFVRETEPPAASAAPAPAAKPAPGKNSVGPAGH
jgi:hypothetical protein